MSLLAPILKPRSLSSHTKIATRSISACVHLPASQKDGYSRRRQRQPDDTRERAAEPGRWQQRELEDVFFKCLALAGSCRSRRPRIATKSSIRSDGTIRASGRCRSHISRRQFSSQISKEQARLAVVPKPPEPDISRDDYMNLVDFYAVLTKKERRYMQGSRSKLVETAKEYPRLASRLVLTPEQEQSPPYSERQVLSPESEEHSRCIRHFKSLLKRRAGHVDLKQLWAAWEALQAPRPRYLHDRVIKRLFVQLTWVESYQQRGASEKYFALLNECIGEGVDLTERIWTSAIIFAGRWARNITNEEVKAAIETWMRMEQFGHRANLVTFSVLFQVAMRAGRFGLAETIFNEVKERGLPLDRMFMINVIHYAGTLRDGDAVRQAFRELVNAGEIIDTSVMNCVILSLYRAGEFAAAENVFLRMKSLHEEKFGTEAPSDWRTRKELAKLLNKTGQDLRKEKEQHEASFFGAMFSTSDRREAIQKASPIAPDARTYQILIKHCVYTSAELSKIKLYLGEMHARGLHVHGSVYVHIMRGFQAHGGYMSAGWDRTSLEELWQEILAQMEPSLPDLESARRARADSTKSYQPLQSDDIDMLGAMLSEKENHKPVSSQQADEDIPSLLQEEPSNTDGAEFQQDAFGDVAEFEARVHVTKGLALSTIKAFHRCAGRNSMMKVWEDIQCRWPHGSHEDKVFVQSIVEKLADEKTLSNM